MACHGRRRFARHRLVQASVVPAPVTVDALSLPDWVTVASLRFPPCVMVDPLLWPDWVSVARAFTLVCVTVELPSAPLWVTVAALPEPLCATSEVLSCAKAGTAIINASAEAPDSTYVFMKLPP